MRIDRKTVKPFRGSLYGYAAKNVWRVTQKMDYSRSRKPNRQNGESKQITKSSRLPLPFQLVSQLTRKAGAVAAEAAHQSHVK